MLAGVPETTSTPQTRGRRAAPMAPDERRRAIVEAVVPLILEHGDDVSTRQIAEAAGIAEGTIFRVFDDKPALLLAAAVETMNPAHGRADLEAALVGLTTLRAKVMVTAQHINERTERVMTVLMALRRLRMAQGEHGTGRGADPRLAFEQANDDLHAMLTDVFAAHRDEMRADPSVAATMLQTLVLGSRHPGSDPGRRLSVDQITDVLLDGVRAHHRCTTEED